MNRSNHLLNDLVAIASDGKAFYEHAATKVNDPDLVKLFDRIASIKADIVSSLSSEIQAGGDQPNKTSTLAGDLAQFYGDLRAMAGHKDYAYVAQLEQSEDRFLKVFEDARISKETSPRAVAALARLAPEVRQCHELIRSRK